MILLALSCVLALQEAKVSISTGGATVETILKDLSRQSNVPLHTADSVRGEILIVEAKDASLNEVMKRIAQADDAEWTQDRDGYTLSRSPKVRKAEEAAEIAERAASLAKVLEGHLKTELASPTPGKYADPGTRLAWRAMQVLGPGTLARLKSGIRVVYSQEPNPMQKRWPGNLTPLVQTFIKEWRDSPKEGSESGAPQPPPMMTPESTSRVLVALSCSIYQGYVVHVYLFNAKGQLIQDCMATMQTAELDSLERSGEGKQVKSSGQPLPLSQSATEFLGVAKSAMAQRPVSMSRDLIGRILDPAKYDPLSFVVGDALATIAKQESRCLVASVPDFCFVTSLFLANGPVTEDIFRTWLLQTSTIDESQPGWMIVKPRYPIDVRELRVDREKMGTFYRTAWKNGGVSLSQLGAYIASQPRRYVETISLFYGFFCMPEIVHMFDPNGVGAIRTFGRLTDQQRNQLTAGVAIPATELSAEARAEVADWIYNGSVFGFGSHAYDTDYVDPTDAFPNGLTMPLMLTQRGTATAAVIPFYNNSDAWDLEASPLTASSLGYELGRQDAGESRTKGTMSSFLFGKVLTLFLELHSPHIELSGELKESHFDRSGKSLAWNELPRDFQSAAATSRNEYIQQKAKEPVHQNPPP